MSQDDSVNRFNDSVHKHSPVYEVELSEDARARLASYYELLLRWNQRLHLVAPCSPEEFATRHVLESMILINRISPDARVVDIGSGAGLPIIPCLIARPDISATLVESSQKKSVFLREALKAVAALNRATIVTKPFEETQSPNAEFVTCRALDEFSSEINALFKWAPASCTLLLFAGDNLRPGLATLNVPVCEFLLPASERRFLFELKKPA